MSSGLTLVHGAAGHLGGHIVKELLALGSAPSSLVAAVRDLNSEGSKQLAKLGVQLRVADFTDKASLEKAYAGIDTVVFVPVPASHIERAIAADNSVTAARNAGIKRFVLVSFPTSGADSVNALNPGYIFAESLVRVSGLASWVIVRMGLWIDNSDASFKYAVQSGVYAAVAAPTDRIPLISREDTAKGIAAVTFNKSLVSKVYDIESNVSVSFAQVAEYLSEAAGKKVVFKTLTVAESAAGIAATLPDFLKPMAPVFANLYASFNQAAAAGELKVTNDFFELTGKQPESVRDFIKRTYKA